MARRQLLVLGTVIVAIVVTIAFLALTGGEPTASPSASPSASLSPSASVGASASPSSSASASASPSPEAGPLQIEWQAVTGLEPGASVHEVSVIDGRWFALGQVEVEVAIWTSDDGRDWTRAEISGDHPSDELTVAYGLAELDGTLVAIGAFGAIPSDQVAWVTWTSDDDGATWTEHRDAPTPAALQAVVEAGPGLVGAGWDYFGTTPFDSWIATTEDGLAWQRNEAEFTSAEIVSLAVLDERIVAVGSTFVDGGLAGFAAYSDDGGATWTVTVEASGDAETLFEVVATDGGFAAVGGGEASGATAWLSADGAAWEAIPISADAEARGLALVDGGFVAVGNVVGQDIGPGLSWTSLDGRTWEAGTEFAPASVRILGADGNGSTVVAGGLCQSESCDSVLWFGEVSR
jgi:hypothetical protein